MQTFPTPALDSTWFASFIEEHAGETSVLLAVSGGLDSMVLWDLVEKAGHPYAIAHVNYHLRGVDSERDAALIASVASERNAKLYVLDDYSLQKNSPGLQASARQIRYEFFASLADRHAKICTAHHADDQAETILLQLGRGGGPASLAGISEAANGRIRPLLSFSKAELRTYATVHGVPFREDASNATDDYLRNRIRHHLLPLAEELFAQSSGSNISKDGFRQNLTRAATQQQALLDFARARLSQQLSEVRSERWPHALNRTKLSSVPGCSFFLHELLRPYAFSSDIVTKLERALRDGNFKKRAYLNKNESIRLVLAGSTVHLEQTTVYDTFKIKLDREGEYVSPLGELSISKAQADQVSGDLEIWVPRIDTLIWRTIRPEDVIRIGEGKSKASKKVLAEAKRPYLGQHTDSVIADGEELLWMVGLRKPPTIETEKAKSDGYRLRFHTGQKPLGIIDF